MITNLLIKRPDAFFTHFKNAMLLESIPSIAIFFGAIAITVIYFTANR